MKRLLLWIHQWWSTSGKDELMQSNDEMTKPAQIARERGYKRLAVISAIGRREYNCKRGFEDGQLCQTRKIE